MRELREDAAEALVATCVPPGLAFGTTDGTAAREAIRGWYHTSVAPVGKTVEQELRTKLEMPGLTLSFPGLEAFASRPRCGSYGRGSRGPAVGVDTPSPYPTATCPPAGWSSG